MRSAPRPDRSGPARRRAAVAAALLALVSMPAGCSSGAPTAAPPAPTASGGASNAAAAGADPAAVAAARKAAGIRACPTTRPTTPARPDGLPDLQLGCLGGDHPVRLAGLRGTPTVINIWAQWCRPCRLEAPHLAQVAARAGGRVRFLGVDYDDPDPLAAIAFARSAGWHYPQLRDPQQSLRSPLRLIGVPATIFVAADGRITYRHNGPYRSTAELTAAVHDHLGVAL